MQHSIFCSFNNIPDLGFPLMFVIISGLWLTLWTLLLMFLNNFQVLQLRLTWQRVQYTTLASLSYTDWHIAGDGAAPLSLKSQGRKLVSQPWAHLDSHFVFTSAHWAAHINVLPSSAATSASARWGVHWHVYLPLCFQPTWLHCARIVMFNHKCRSLLPHPWRTQHKKFKVHVASPRNRTPPETVTKLEADCCNYQ